METNEDFQPSNQLDKIVVPGDYIGEGYVAGHGTYCNQADLKIYATLAGVVHKIDRVICVKPVRS